MEIYFNKCLRTNLMYRTTDEIITQENTEFRVSIACELELIR